MKKLSVIIRTFNEEKHLGRLLFGILEQDIDDQPEIIIVDSGSTDATLAIASRFKTTIVSIRPEEFSFGRSLNLGCSRAHGDIIVAASAHVYPAYNDWLSNLTKPFSDPDTVMVYGRQIGNEVTKFSEHMIFSKLFPNISNPSINHPFSNNANAAFRRHFWQQNHFDEELTGLEDIALAKLALKKGRKVFYEAKAEVFHIHDESAKSIYHRYKREAVAMKHIFPAERFGTRDFVTLLTRNILGDYHSAFKSKALGKHFFEIPLFRFLQFFGTYQGFRQSSFLTPKMKRHFYYPNRPTAKQEHIRERVRHAIDYSSTTKSRNPSS